MTSLPPLDPNPAFLPTEPQCDEAALEAFAKFLAKEMDYLACIAGGHTVRWYREQIGPEICSVERGAMLRTLTTEVCLEYARQHRVASPDLQRRPISIDRDAGRIHVGFAPDASKPSPKWSRTRRLAVFTTSVIGVLATAVWVTWW